MAPVTYSGTLAPKKKSELKDLAVALGISDDGNKDELQSRIKRHLDRNQPSLEDKPAFAGLYGKKKRVPSVQPQHRVAPPSPDSSKRASGSDSPVLARALPSRRAKAVEPASTADISSMLKSPFSAHSHDTPPATTHALISDPTPSPILSVVRRAEVDAVVDIVRRKEEIVVKSAAESIVALRVFLSNSRNIWSLTALVELVYILYTIVPWQQTQLPLTGTAAVPLSHPIWAVFTTAAFWSVLVHWALPALLIPALAGTLVSFAPAPTSPSSPQLPFDALTASIVRLAAHIAYPFPALDAQVQGIDVLGPRWRVLDAAVGVAFAFAEVIVKAPANAANAVSPLAASSASLNPSRRAITAEETVLTEIE